MAARIITDNSFMRFLFFIDSLSLIIDYYIIMQDLYVLLFINYNKEKP